MDSYGYSYIATSKSGKGNVEALQTWIDSFLEKNNWYERELDWFRRSRRDGEWFARIYPQDDGIPEIRCVEPEQIRAKDDTPEWFFGVKVPGHDKDNLKGYDFEKPIAYWITWDGAIENGEEVDASEMVMMKINTDICIRRGLSDFFPTQGALDGVEKLLRSATSGESVRQAIAYMRQFQQAPQSAVQSLQTASTDFQTPIPTATGAPKLLPTTVVVPGAVIDMPEGLEYKDGPKGASTNATDILTAAYQALAAYWSVPSWFISGASDANYASALVEESPMVRNFEKEQKLYANKFKEILVKSIYTSIEQGVLPEDCLEDATITVHCPPVVVRNAMEETQRNQLLNQNKLMSRRTWSDREELDFDSEQEEFNNEAPVQVNAPNDNPKPEENNPHAQYQAAVQTDDTK